MPARCVDTYGGVAVQVYMHCGRAQHGVRTNKFKILNAKFKMQNFTLRW